MMEDLIGCTKEVVNMEKKRVNNEDKIQQRKDESLFKIETSLPEIHANANDPVGTINALEKFEKTLEESKVTTRAVWVRFFREKCKGLQRTGLKRHCYVNLDLGIWQWRGDWMILLRGTMSMLT
jgi:hypothetical protein